MITIYERGPTGLVVREAATDSKGVVWIDLLDPTKAEDRAVEAMTGIDIPTREEMSEIEVSSRLYSERGAHYLTSNVLFASDTPDPQTTAITFILQDGLLITVRYAEPKAFALFLTRARKGDVSCTTAIEVMLGLLEAIIDREADLIERLQADTEKIAQSIFGMKGGERTKTGRFDVVLRQIGRVGENTSRTLDSLLSLDRVITFLSSLYAGQGDAKAIRQRLKTQARDVHSLTDHVHHLSQRIAFMLDASVGMVTIEQNQIIKLFSVAAVMLMPPTLIASIYGMNFKHMPELDWVLGYPLALFLMVVSAAAFYAYFRRKGWL